MVKKMISPITSKNNFNTSTNNQQKNVVKSKAAPISTPSICFGLNLRQHAWERMQERGISIDNLLDTIQNGRKFFIIENKKERIVNLNYKNEGKVPEGIVLVVTDKTGNDVVTAHKVLEDECEIMNNKLIKNSHYNAQNTQILEDWLGSFDDKIFRCIRIK